MQQSHTDIRFVSRDGVFARFSMFIQDRFIFSVRPLVCIQVVPSKRSNQGNALSFSFQLTGAKTVQKCSSRRRNVMPRLLVQATGEHITSV